MVIIERVCATGTGLFLSVTDWDEGVKTVGYWTEGEKNATNQDAQWGWRLRVTGVEVTAITRLAINIPDLCLCLKGYYLDNADFFFSFPDFSFSASNYLVFETNKQKKIPNISYL